MASLNNGYTRWSGESTGIWQRRWVITQTGLSLCFKQKVLRAIIFLVFSTTLFQLAIILFAGQLTSPDSRLIVFFGNAFGEDALRAANGMASWVLLYPEVVVDGLFRVVFFQLAYTSTFASFFAIALFIAKLITHDIASQAIVIYNSKALTRFDYFLGKLGIVAIILSLIWIVPVLFLWVVGNLVSPDWSFFIHSFKALLRALLVAVVAIVSLSFLSMALSALARKTSFAVSLWIMLWIFSGLIGGAAQLVHPFGGYVSVPYALKSFAWAVYRLDEVWNNAASMLPFFGMFFGNAPSEFPSEWQLGPTSVWQPLFFLGLFVGLSAFILNRRIRSE